MSIETFYNTLALEIIREQELIIGPLAWEQAVKVPGLAVVDKNHPRVTSENAKQVIEQLVAQYERLFGQASVETCRVAAERILHDYANMKEQVPKVLR